MEHMLVIVLPRDPAGALSCYRCAAKVDADPGDWMAVLRGATPTCHPCAISIEAAHPGALRPAD